MFEPFAVFGVERRLSREAGQSPYYVQKMEDGWKSEYKATV